MAKRDYYEVLGVNKAASDDEIKRAFRKAAKQYHPDLHPNDSAAEAKFKEVNEAYDVLSDPQKRSQYDQFGHAAFDPAAGPGGGFNGYSAQGFGDFSDIFSSFFGGGFGSRQDRTGPVDGKDLGYRLTLTFEEAVFGAHKEITINREENCPTCGGSGAKPGTQPKTCATCNGTGQVRMRQQTIMGVMYTDRPCDACGGRGKVIESPCSDCRGGGRVRRSHSINVNIPAGVNTGDTLTVRGEGDAGLRGGANGDVYIKLNVKPHKTFVRKDNDIHLDITIPVTTAMLGGTIDLETLTGAVKHTIPAGTQPGTTFRLKGLGVAKPNSSYKGDMYVHTSVEIPKKLNPEQTELVQQLRDSLDGTKHASGEKRRLFKKK
ncbi:MAG: molecular chaperone DnaJ [Clostridia bacterium]|nr:molecular chaperone DnaJ [Clostridia bacterium]